VSLRTLDLRPVYDSSVNDLVADLVVPLLSNCVEYYRGVGFFSSGWLRVAAVGLSKLAENGGTARIILSPILERSDWEAIQLGERAKRDEVLRELLQRNVTHLQESLEHDTLNCLAWLITDGLLELRFAVPRTPEDFGVYHDKVAFFKDGSSEVVAIHGSLNDSVQGTLNGEAFSVFKSWEIGHVPFVEQHVVRLLRLWNDENERFRAFPLPEAVRAQIVSLRTTPTRPYRRGLAETPMAGDRAAPHVPVQLMEHQIKAIEAWFKAGRRGILEMATGTGKTVAALAAAVSCFRETRRLACIVLVPYLHLLEQWETHCRHFGFRPVVCSGSHTNWRVQLRAAVADFKLCIPQLCVLAVHNTGASEDFLRLVVELPKSSCLLIADESHALGALQMRRALYDGAEMRLALTATPKRWYDEEGTQALLDYFGDVCFQLDIGDAIGKELLVPYEYRPVLVQLTADEEDTVSYYSRRIGILLANKERTFEEAEELKRLLLERAKVVARAEEKYPAAMTAIADHVARCRAAGVTPKGILVYCPPGRHKQVLEGVADLGLICHDFVHEVGMVERERLLRDFACGHLQALVAIKCLDEGVDVPSTQYAFFLASTTNPREFIQRRGRVLRRAEGKGNAVLWDFLVVPSDASSPEVAAFLLRREMPRFAEFTSCASNKYAAREVLRPILDHYQMLDLLDMKPWDVYHQDKDLYGDSNGINE